MAERELEPTPTTRFADRASDYARFRPSYPAAAIDFMLEGRTAPSLLAADIGAGTGIASRLLADRGVRVLALEPNEAMRTAAEPHPLVTFRVGTAEVTGLGDHSVDLVLCAQSFHWFRPVEALAEFRRILRPGGRLAVMVNDRDSGHTATCAFGDAELAASDRERPGASGAAIEAPLRAAGWSVLPATFPNAQALTREGLIGRARSASYVHKEGPRYEQLLHDLDTLWAAHRDSEGLVTLAYRTVVFRVDVTGSG